MPEILTTNFKTDTTRLFVDDALTNEYYVFVSGLEIDSVENSIRSKNEFLEQTIFAKRVKTDDIKFMIKNYPWQRGNVYTQYDDTIDLEDQNFYSVVGPTNNDTGDYRVYKCLFNNFGAETTTPPNYAPDTVDQIYRTADGYIWKFMYVISRLQFDAYNSLGYIPVIGDFDTNPTQVTAGSPIDDIRVENITSNQGYRSIGGILDGNRPENLTATTGRIKVRFGTNDFSQVANYYEGQSLYITRSNGSSELYDILNYTYDFTNGLGVFVVLGQPGPSGDNIGSNSSAKVFPKVKISGDGTGVKAIPVITNGQITSITVLDSGSGYNNAIGEIVNPAYDFAPDDPATTDIKAIIRPILSPKDGHGSNLLDELHCKHFLLYSYITALDNNFLPIDNVYAKVGVVRNPEWANTSPGYVSPDLFDNRIAIESDDYASLQKNDLIYQIDEDQQITFEGVVHEIDASSNTFYISNYTSYYQNIGSNDTALDPTKDLERSNGQLIRINNIVESPYLQRTGKVYFMENFFPLSRTVNSREEFKFIMEF